MTFKSKIVSTSRSTSKAISSFFFDHLGVAVNCAVNISIVLPTVKKSAVGRGRGRTRGRGGIIGRGGRTGAIMRDFLRISRMSSILL